MKSWCFGRNSFGIIAINSIFQAFLYHILDCNPHHITIALLKEYLTILPLIAVEASASNSLPNRLPWADVICMPLTSLIRAPTLDEAREFELKMTKRCGGDFNRNLALCFPIAGEMSKRDIYCRCRWARLYVRASANARSACFLSLITPSRTAIMSIRNEKSGGGSARAKELHDLFGRSAIYLGCGEIQSGLKSYFGSLLSSAKKVSAGSTARWLLLLCSRCCFVFDAVLYECVI